MYHLPVSWVRNPTCFSWVLSQGSLRLKSSYQLSAFSVEPGRKGSAPCFLGCWKNLLPCSSMTHHLVSLLLSTGSSVRSRRPVSDPCQGLPSTKVLSSFESPGLLEGPSLPLNGGLDQAHLVNSPLN